MNSIRADPSGGENAAALVQFRNGRTGWTEVRKGSVSGKRRLFIKIFAEDTEMGFPVIDFPFP